jgi:hypothetical protein
VIKLRIIIWVGHVDFMRERLGAFRVLVGKHEGKRLFGRRRHRWKNNIKMDFQEVGWGMDWIDVAQDRDRWRTVVNTGINLWVPRNVRNFVTI